ncbi:MAG: hypothetical protein KTR16_04875 [Acidiferrobacterales bacterium]|nr:hypothetical protein [Acidiferrobacterales bacterium]
MSYLHHRRASFAKTQPYTVSIEIQSTQDSSLIADYDYGYGFNGSHQQVFEVEGSERQLIQFTISAWMQLQSLRIVSEEITSVTNLKIEQGDSVYVEPSAGRDVSKTSPLLITELNSKLLSSRD